MMIVMVCGSVWIFFFIVDLVRVVVEVWLGVEWLWNLFIRVSLVFVLLGVLVFLRVSSFLNRG